MMVKLLETAETDLEEGYLFYEKQKAGLGDLFLESLSLDMESLSLHGGIHRRIYGSHRLLAHRFPFAIYYDMINEEVWIWAVMDCRRKPSHMFKRLKSHRRSS
ncbi:MAG: type II toxin-antitoxin system RelE/ParE family toxin [Verrucomicrobiae bacterium]|nr:type II toxin-antitoxin system RelE/ParE family toxin [Verrucomicrobiae bacterium]